MPIEQLTGKPFHKNVVCFAGWQSKSHSRWFSRKHYQPVLNMVNVRNTIYCIRRKWDCKKEIFLFSNSTPISTKSAVILNFFHIPFSQQTFYQYGTIRSVQIWINYEKVAFLSSLAERAREKKRSVPAVTVNCWGDTWCRLCFSNPPLNPQESLSSKASQPEVPFVSKLITIVNQQLNQLAYIASIYQRWSVLNRSKNLPVPSFSFKFTLNLLSIF